MNTDAPTLPELQQARRERDQRIAVLVSLEPRRGRLIAWARLGDGSIAGVDVQQHQPGTALWQGLRQADADRLAAAWSEHQARGRAA